MDSHGRSADLPEVKKKQEREVYTETCQNDLMSTSKLLQIIFKSAVNNDLLEIAKPDAPWCINI